MKIHHAELILTKGALGADAAIYTARELAAKDSRYFLTDQFSNSANPLAHYETTAAEILADFPYERIDVLIAGIGTGGTIVGIARRLKEKYPDIRVIGIAPPPDDTIQGLKCLTQGYIPPILDFSLVTEIATVTSQQATLFTKELLEKEGIFAGSSSGAVVYQAIKTAHDMDEGNMVVVLADGGWKYLSMDLWAKAK